MNKLKRKLKKVIKKYLVDLYIILELLPFTLYGLIPPIFLSGVVIGIIFLVIQKLSWLSIKIKLKLNSNKIKLKNKR